MLRQVLSGGPTWPRNDVDDAGRDPGLRHQFRDSEGAQWRQLGRLEDHRVSGREGRAHLPAAEHQREVPRNDRPDDAERLAQDVVQEPRFDRNDVALELVGHAAEVAEGGRRSNDVQVSAVADRMTGVEALETCQFVGMGLDQIGQPEEDPPAGGGAHPAPVRVCRGGRHDGPIDIGRSRSGDPCDHGAVVRVDRLEGRPVGGVDERPADEQPVPDTDFGSVLGQRHRVPWVIGRPGPADQSSTGTDGSWPLEMRPGRSGSAFSQTSSIARFGA